MRRIVISGGAGFIGHALVNRLADQGSYEIVVLDRPHRLDRAAQTLRTDKLLPCEFNLGEELVHEFEGADCLVQLAYFTDPTSSMTNTLKDIENISTNLHLFDQAIKAGVESVLFASSGGTVYGSPSTLPVPETTGGSPISAYGVSKRAVEMYLDLLAGKTRTINMRIGNPYGPYQLQGTAVGFLAYALNAINTGAAVNIYGDGSTVRDYLYVDDLAIAIESLINSTKCTGTYNIGSGQGHSLSDLLKILATVTGQEVKANFTSPRSFDVPAIVLDISKLQQDSGWTPSTSLAEGIQLMWDFLRKSA